MRASASSLSGDDVKDFFTVDFETEHILSRPLYPPKPVGVSIKRSTEKRGHYYAWSHPTKNNCTEKDGFNALKKVAQSGLPIVCHNTKFDYEVWLSMGLPELPWERLHDTMFMLFLDDPHASTFALKPASEKLLGLKPEERDVVKDWLFANQQALRDSGHLYPDVVLSASPNAKPTEAGHPRQWGAYISLAPGDLVGDYADGDVIRTEKLVKLLLPSLKKRGMLEAYDRERELLPIILKMEQQGLRVDLKRLRVDVKLYEDALWRVDNWLHKQLKLGPEDKIAGQTLIDALIAVKKVDVDKLDTTDTGAYSTDQDSLGAAVTDKTLNGMLTYRSQLTTCVGTYLKSWWKMAEVSKGFIFTSWNQTRNANGKHSKGTRTGRLSATWFMNAPKEFDPIFKHDEPDVKKAKSLPKAPIPLPPLPLVRSYIIPFDKGHVLLDRDYSQQEPRILAHFDAGSLMEKYNEEPWIDFHDFARAELEKVGLFYERKPVKNTNLGLIYGMGNGKLAADNNMTVEEAKQLKTAVMRLYPGLKDMYDDMKQRAKNNEPIHTWGGREYYCEPPKVVKGRTMSFDYKLVNTLIQGSAADCTKQAIINLSTAIKKLKKVDTWFILLTVHDEILISAPEREAKEAMETLREAMESVKFDVPMLSEGTISKENWAAMKDHDVKGKLVYNYKQRS